MVLHISSHNYLCYVLYIFVFFKRDLYFLFIYKANSELPFIPNHNLYLYALYLSKVHF